MFMFKFVWILIICNAKSDAGICLEIKCSESLFLIVTHYNKKDILSDSFNRDNEQNRV